MFSLHWCKTTHAKNSQVLGTTSSILEQYLEYHIRPIFLRIYLLFSRTWREILNTVHIWQRDKTERMFGVEDGDHSSAYYEDSIPPEVAYREACRRQAAAKGQRSTAVIGGVGRRGAGVDVEAIMVSVKSGSSGFLSSEMTPWVLRNMFALNVTRLEWIFFSFTLAVAH